MSNIERTDTNVGNIKKDIERCEQLIKPEHANWIGISNQLAIAHMIDRIKELEAKLELKKWGDLDNTQFEEYMNQFIPKQKVKDSYLKMEKEYARKVYDNNYNRNEVKKEEFYKRQVYEELLEDK